jgi:hypothetical protein
MTTLANHRGVSSSLFFFLLVTLTLIPTHVGAAETLFDGVYEKNKTLNAVRVGQDVIITWNRDVSSDISYSLFVGEFVIRAGGKGLPKVPKGSQVGTFTDTSRSNAIYSLIYDPKKFKSFTATGKVFFEHRVRIDNSNQAVVLIRKTNNSFTYDYDIISDRDNSIKAGVLRFTCRVSAWGLPLSKGLLSVSNLSLTLISYLPGGQAAGLAGTVLDKFELAADTTLQNGVEVGVGTAQYVVKADQIDLWSKLKPKDSLQLAFNGVKGQGVIKNIKRIPNTNKFSVGVDVYFAKEDIVKLYDVISTARAEYKETNTLCAKLN